MINDFPASSIMRPELYSDGLTCQPCCLQYNEVMEQDENSPTKCKMTTKLVLEMDEEKKPLVEVDSKLIRQLKPHQVEGMCTLSSDVSLLGKCGLACMNNSLHDL